MSSTTAGLGGFPHGVTQIINAKSSEPLVIFPFLSIYHYEQFPQWLIWVPNIFLLVPIT